MTHLLAVYLTFWLRYFVFFSYFRHQKYKTIQIMNVVSDYTKYDWHEFACHPTAKKISSSHWIPWFHHDGTYFLKQTDWNKLQIRIIRLPQKFQGIFLMIFERCDVMRIFVLGLNDVITLLRWPFDCEVVKLREVSIFYYQCNSVSDTILTVWILTSSKTRTSGI